MVPSSVAKMLLAGALRPLAEITKPGVVLRTVPSGAEGDVPVLPGGSGISTVVGSRWPLTS